MNPLVAQQVALDDALVTPENCFVISKCNMRIEPSKTQKEATYQVVLDTLKLSPCYQTFSVTADVPEIYMHQFWFTISKIKDTSSYQFKLDKKKFRIGVEVFQIGYIEELESITELYIDHISQPWISLASIINKCLSGKTTCVDQLRLSRAQILWGMYHKKNVDFVALIWEDFMYQIDNRQSTAARRSSMPYPSVLGVLKFVSKYEENQVYGKPILDVMLSKEVMVIKAYKTYLAFAIGNAIPKKARKRTTAHITPIKESSLTTDDNIISQDPDATLELAKSISRTEAKEQEARRLVHETHERLMTEKPMESRRKTGVFIRYTPVVSTKKTQTRSLKLKVMEILLDAAMLATDTRKAIKASKCDERSQHQSGGSSKGAGITPEVPDESQAKSTHTNKGDGITPEVPDVSKAMIQESDEDWGSEEDEVVLISEDERTDSDDDKSIDLNQINDEEETQGDEFVHTLDEYVPTDDETQDVYDKEYDTTTAAPATQKEKIDVPPSSSSCTVSSNYDLKFHQQLMNTLDQVWETFFRRSSRSTLKNLDKDTLIKFDLKQALFDSMHESKSFNKHPANKTLYHALMESLIVDEDAMDQGVVDLIKHKKRPHDDADRDQDPLAGPDWV
ncbi:hypothetical protein Tco_0226503 [Tanacetum coccineum]